MRKPAVTLALLAGLSSACGPLAPDAAKLAPPSAHAIVPLKAERPVVALVLGSGGARGFAHVGVIKALEAAGVKPDLVVGSSSGAIVAALYAGGYSGHALVELAAELDQGALIDFSLFGQGWVRGEALQAFVNRSLANRPIERLERALAVIATESGTGRMIVFNRGDAGLAVRASASVPDLFIPPVIEGVTYIDGGLTSPVPVHVAKAMGADLVIAVDLTRWHRARELAAADLAAADVVIRPETVRTRLLDFSAKFQNIAAGEAAAQAAARDIVAAIERAARRKSGPGREVVTPANAQ
ncbi:MAG TPA: patatin-like phospholipase family protein [Burkholderiales bacterium]|nr:patatin-like phospholipase family protein [Burkholderiales bacterium]